MTPDAKTPVTGRRRTALLLTSAIVTLVLVALGVWQLERLGWKLDLIARVDARVHAAPEPLPGPSSWAAVTAEADEYRHVTARGRYLNEDETLVQAVTDRGPGFWVVTPVLTDQGFEVLVNRGFVPTDRRSAATRQAGQIAGETQVTGLLRISEPGGGFLRANDPAADRWYSRDVAAIAKARGLGTVAPYFVDADATPNAGGLPVGGLTVIRFSNNHLLYALTWFALAALLLAATAYILWGERKAARQRPGVRIGTI
ncbi:MAG: SURF1 family protein [Devosia sp.]